MNKIYSGLVGCFLLALIIYSCDSSGDDDGNPPPPEFDRAGMLKNYADNLILPDYTNLQTAASTLKTAAEAFATDPTIANLEVLQNDFKSARQSWQQVSFFQFGPAETNTLRTILNTFPTDTDKINNNIENGGYTLGSVDNIAAGGFPAIAYLIHGLGDTSGEIVEALTTHPLASQRMTYLIDNVDFVKSNVDLVTDDWLPAGGDYYDSFLGVANAGTGSGSSMSLLVNAMILHYERFLRDGKIGIPAGVRSAGVPRPTATEAFHGGYSAELMVANLQAFKDLFTGDNGLGLDDNLIFLESPTLANDIIAGLDQAISDSQALTDPLSGNIENDNDQVIEVFTSLQQVLVLIKVDMTSILGISITFQDNDGD